MKFSKQEDETLLVTGATGFIGFHLVQALNNLGCNVLALDNNLRGGSELARKFFEEKGIPFFDIDMCNPFELSQLDLELPNIKSIFHLAAFNGTNNFYKKPFTVLKNSTLPLINLLDKLISLKLSPKILYTGSSECYAYGVQKKFNNVPTTEDAVLALGPMENPRWSYACGKLNGEYALFNAYSEYKIPFVIARVHNIYGPRMGRNHFFSDFINRCLNNEFFLYAPYQTRSYHFIDDCVNTLILLMNSASANLNVFNVGSSKETMNLDCANLILDELNINQKLSFRNAPEGSINRRKPDLTKLFNMFPSLKEQTSLEDGIKATVAWYSKRNIDFDDNEN